jgi:predicted MFS family arabinose efflux permease
MLMVSKTQQRAERKISAWLLEEEPTPPVDEGPLRPSLQNQIIACIICNLGAFSFGTAMGWSSPALPELTNSHELTEGQAAWAGGMLPLGAMVSLPIFGYMARTKGRKPAAYFVGVPLAVIKKN